MTGIERIAKERQEQIEKHGITVEMDKNNNHFGQLMCAVESLIHRKGSFDPDKTDEENEEYDKMMDEPPHGWNPVFWKKMIDKDYKDRLVIAGALIAAEIDAFYTRNPGE